jgi:hypothetical protein
MSSHKSRKVVRREYSQFSIIFVLASQYRSHPVPFVIAAYCTRLFLLLLVLIDVLSALRAFGAAST